MSSDLQPMLAAGVLALAATALGAVRFGLDAFSRGKLLQSIDDDGTRDLIERRLDHLDRIKVAALVLSVCAEALLVALVAIIGGDLAVEQGHARALGAVIAALAATAFLVPLARLLPRAVVMRGFEPALCRLLPTLHWVSVVLTPVTVPLLAFRRGLARALRLDDKAARSDALAEELIATVAEGERDGFVDTASAEILQNVVDFREVDVAEVLTPRTDMKWIDANATVAAALKLAGEEGHSRLPVGDGDADHIVGVFYVRDVIEQLADIDELRRELVREVARKPYFVPETKKVTSLLSEFRSNQLQIAIVLDEYGGTAGLVTIEDVLEEIVGDIVDEHDDEADEPDVKKLGQDRFEVRGRAHVSVINEELGVELPESENFDTIGGFVFSTLGRMPRRGQTLTHGNVELRVVDADDRRIKKVELRVLTRAAEDE